MLYTFFYLFAISALLFFLFFMIVYTLSLIYSSFMGSPYVPTKQKEAEFILSELKPKNGKLLVELGSGDGRLVRTAVKKYGVRGLGIDINPLIVLYAKLLAKIHKISCTFDHRNIFDGEYRNADYIYLFLMPEILKKLLPVFENQLKKNTVVVSHGFRLIGWESYLFKTIPHKPFPTYFYRIIKNT